MLKPAEVREHLDLLGLSTAEAAKLLDVGLRTARRWTQPDTDGTVEPIPGPAEQALRAWLRLHRLGLAWRPDARSLVANDAETIARHRQHALELDALLERVRKRGGPAAPWDVDLERGCATLGPMRVTFYRLANGGFSPQSYSRADGLTDLKRDWPLVEDAYACIARKLAAQTSPGALRFAFDEPNLSLAWSGVVELWDNSLSPAVLASIRCDALRTALELDDLPDEDCPRLVRANKAIVAELAEQLFAEGRFEERMQPFVRCIDIDDAALRPVAHRFRHILYSATLERMKQDAP